MTTTTHLHCCGDVFMALTAQRGEERAGHEYRSGHYVKDES